MPNLIKRFLSEQRESFSQVRGNARAVVVTHVFWALPFSLYSPYLTQYMMGIGCTAAEVGVVNAAGMVSGAVIGLFAGWLTDRLGRRRTNLIADTISWGLYCLALGFARSFAWFMAAAILNSFVRIISVSWNCTLAEGTPPDKRMNVYWWLNIIATLSACCTPLMGLMLGGGGPERLVAVMRWVLLASAGVHTASFLVRNAMHRETDIGLERMCASRDESPLMALRAYGPMFRLLAKSPVLLAMISLRALYYAQVNVKGTFFSVTAVQGLGFPLSVIGLMNLIAGLSMLPAQLFLMPRLYGVPTGRVLAASLVTLLVSAALQAVSPAGSMALLVSTVVASAVGAVVTSILVDTEVANALPDDDRAKLMALLTVLMVLLSALFQLAGGWLAVIPDVGPRLPMAMVAVMLAACLALLGAGEVRRKA